MYFAEEDVYANYSKLMLKYFLAEGAMSKHKLLVASADVSAQTLIEVLKNILVLAINHLFINLNGDSNIFSLYTSTIYSNRMMVTLI